MKKDEAKAIQRTDCAFRKLGRAMEALAKEVLKATGIFESLKPKPPKPEPPKTIQQLTLKEKTKLIEQKRSEQGWICCHNCGRSAGMRYGKKSEEGKGITIKTVKVYENNILVKRNYCTECLAKNE